jgi:hypothetical protein
MDPILEKMLATEFLYSNEDIDSVIELEERIASYARKRQLITYSQLVEGVTFHFSSIKNGASYTIDIQDWTGIDREIIGNLLGFISTRSYQAHGFMLSALVVNKKESKPSEEFFKWMRRLNVLPNLNDETVFSFWGQQIILVNKYYSNH